MSEVAVRPMTLADVDEAVRVQIAAFNELAQRTGEPVDDVGEAHLERAKWRHRHFVEHDPDGSWAATIDDCVVGCGLALRRENLWGLSLLVVDPSTQSGGVGRQLLDATLRYGDGCSRGIIQASTDPRAIRAYATSGFALFPQMVATGKPVVAETPTSVARVRDGDTDDHAFADEVDRMVRGAGRGPDHAIISASAEMHVVDDRDGRGYAYRRDGEIYLLAATDDATASALLWRCLARAVELDIAVTVDHLTAEQKWAIDACFAARLKVAPGGPVFWRNATPPPAYLPSGAFL